jgi:dihydrofolate reductase
MVHRSLVVYIAVSLDGYIAGQDGNLDFLSIAEHEGEDYGYAEFNKTVDTVIWGRKTYDKVLSFGIEFPHKDKRCIVLSNNRKGTDEHVEYYSGSVVDLVAELRGSQGKDIYIDGGAETIHTFRKHGLIDRYILSVIPVLLGGGTRLFGEGLPTELLKLNSYRSFDSGVTQLHYEVVR